MNERETPVDALPPCQSDACKAPISKRHIKRRLLPKGCKPRKLFKKQASYSSSGDKWQHVTRKCILRECAEETILSCLWSDINELCTKLCYGCEVDHPSQREHDWRLMATNGERTDMFLEKAFICLDHDKTFWKFKTELSKLHDSLSIPSKLARKFYDDVYEKFRQNYNYLEKLMLK